MSTCLASTASILEILLAEKAKLIIAAADWPRAAGDLARQSPRLAAYLEPLVFTRASSGEVVGVIAAPAGDGVANAGDGGPADLFLPAPPRGMCILAAWSDEGRRSLELLRDWWKAKGSGDPPTSVVLFDPLPEGSSPTHPDWLSHVYRKAAELAMDMAHASAIRSTGLAAQLYELRRDHEETRTAVEAMQGLIYEIRRAPFTLAFSLPPGEKTFVPDASLPTVVKQLVPLGTEGLAGIDLFSPGAPDGSDGELWVSLICREEDRTLATWCIPYREVMTGWLRCGFEKALALPYRNLELEIRWHTLQGPPVPLALSPVGDWQELLACTAEGALPGALSMLLWTAVAGQLLSTKPLPHQPEEYTGDVGVRKYRLASRQLAGVVRTASCDLEYLHLLPGGKGLRLHPFLNLVTSAVIPNACLCTTSRVVAVVAIQHEQSKSPVEYAMCLTTPGFGRKRFPLGDDGPGEGIIATSGWQTIPNDGLPHGLVIALDRPLETIADLHLATRLPEGAVADYAWADWLELLVELKEGTHCVAVAAASGLRD